ncbi:MAG: SMC-Scp complex subunit ScpB [Nitrososphaerales archaeon]
MTVEGQGGPSANAPVAGYAQPSPALEMPALIEALLFVAPAPIPLSRLAQMLEVAEESVHAALDLLADRYASERRGVRVIRRADRIHLTTAPEAAPYIEKFLGLDLSSKLSAAALETLAVIAYRQPLTRGGIEAIRGVNCDAVLKTLLARALIEPVGRLEQPGRPFLYGTTLQFLQYFGLEGLDRLPPLPSSES